MCINAGLYELGIPNTASIAMQYCGDAMLRSFASNAIADSTLSDVIVFNTL